MLFLCGIAPRKIKALEAEFREAKKVSSKNTCASHFLPFNPQKHILTVVVLQKIQALEAALEEAKIVSPKT